MMPRMNGFELCREVKTNLDISHIPFVLLTAYHNSQNMYTGYKTGADAFAETFRNRRFAGIDS